MASHNYSAITPEIYSLADLCEKNSNIDPSLYTVHQVKGTEGTEFIADFDVFIDSEETEYKYLINDPYFYSFLKVVKTDTETGKQIAYAGAGFEIYKPNGEKVEMTYTYPYYD